MYFMSLCGMGKHPHPQANTSVYKGVWNISMAHSHNLYDLKYHVVFCSKYRHRILTGEVATRYRVLIREVCASNYVDIISGSMSPDHVHLLLFVPPVYRYRRCCSTSKGRVVILLQGFDLLRRRYWCQHLWARGYFGVTVGNVNSEDAQRYIKNQEAHHKRDDFRISEF
jgi:putative transposase